MTLKVNIVSFKEAKSLKEDTIVTSINDNGHKVDIKLDQTDSQYYYSTDDGYEDPIHWGNVDDAIKSYYDWCESIREMKEGPSQEQWDKWSYEKQQAWLADHPDSKYQPKEKPTGNTDKSIKKYTSGNPKEDWFFADIGDTITDTKTGKSGKIVKKTSSGNDSYIHIDFGDGKLKRLNVMDYLQTQNERYDLELSEDPNERAQKKVDAWKKANGG